MIFHRLPRTFRSSWLRSTALTVVCASSLPACEATEPVSEDQEIEGTVQQIRAGRGRKGDTYLGMDVLVTDKDGNAVPCDGGNIQLNVTATVNGKPIKLPANAVQTSCLADQPTDVAMVLDNSGSEKSHAKLVQVAAHSLADPILDAGGRVSVVRVSTVAEKLADLSAAPDEVNAAIDKLFVGNGWTALYDGIRMGNETLGTGMERDPRKDRYGSASAFCEASSKLAVVAVTDGNDNNSAGEKLGGADDGLDTRFKDLLKLNVNGITTPIYTVGVGKDVNELELSTLSKVTGGKHISVESYKDLPGVFEAVSEYSNQSQKVCTTLPKSVCGDVEIEVSYVFEGKDGKKTKGSRTESIHVECDTDSLNGRAAVVLLTMSNPGLDSSVAQGIITRTVDWVAPSSGPNVLVVLDDDHHGEFQGDADYIAKQLKAAGYDVDRLDEPNDGIKADQLAGYDVVWFTNPGYPVDDESSMRVLRDFLVGGGGIVLSGDDMAWTWGNSFSMSPYTHLSFQDNGTAYCGRFIDNNAGDVYTVTFEGSEHPILAGIEGTSFTYGDDIDTTTPLNWGEEVLAWAGASWDKGCTRVPVIVTYDPDPTLPRQIGNVANEGYTLNLACPDGQVMSSIDFASYGTPDGAFPGYVTGSCNAESSAKIVAKYCEGQSACSVPATNDVFGDPCWGTYKRLAVSASCTQAE